MKKLSLILVLFLSSVALSAQEKQSSIESVGAIYPIKSIDIDNIKKITYGDEESFEEKINDTSLCGQRIFVKKKNYDDTKPDSVYIYNLKGDCQGYKVLQYIVNESENTVSIQILGIKRNGLIKFIGHDSIVVHIPEDDYLITWSGKL